MAKISAFEIPGLDCWFYSRDHHPPHFHVKKSGCWEIKVYILESGYETLFPKRRGRGKPPTSKEIKSVLDALSAHRDVILKEWEEKVNTGDSD